jgi:hypothetical protein
MPNRSTSFIADDHDFKVDEGDCFISTGPGTTSTFRQGDKRSASALDDGNDNPSPLPAVNNKEVPAISSGFSKARAMKMSLELGLYTPDFSSKRHGVEQDPENHMINRLRCDEHYAWGVIAEILNGERIKQGGNPTLTSAAIYSRFVRNAPRIAQMQGEIFDPKGYMHIKNEKKSRSKNMPLPPLSEPNQVMLVEAYEEVQANFWEHVADSMRIRAGRKFSAEDCARLFKSI